MICDHGVSGRPHPATRTFDVPGSSLVRLCETHAAFWVARGHRPAGTIELVDIDLACSDVGNVAELAAADGARGSSFIVPRAVYLRWAAARVAWEDAQAEMTTELSKGSVGAMALASELNGQDRRSA